MITVRLLSNMKAEYDVTAVQVDTIKTFTLVQFNDVLVVSRAIYIVSVANITERSEESHDQKCPGESKTSKP